MNVTPPPPCRTPPLLALLPRLSLFCLALPCLALLCAGPDAQKTWGRKSRYLSQVANLAEDLRNERANHENLRRSLEQAMRDIEERTALLAEAEQESQANHEKNLELTRTIQEMTSVAEEQRVQWQQQLLQQQQQLLEQQQLQQEQQQDLAASNSRGGNGELVDGGGGEGDGEEQEEVESLRRELEKLKAAMKLKTRELEAVNARVREVMKYEKMQQQTIVASTVGLSNPQGKCRSARVLCARRATHVRRLKPRGWSAPALASDPKAPISR